MQLGPLVPFRLLTQQVLGHMQPLVLLRTPSSGGPYLLPVLLTRHWQATDVAGHRLATCAAEIGHSCLWRAHADRATGIPSMLLGPPEAGH